MLKVGEEWVLIKDRSTNVVEKCSVVYKAQMIIAASNRQLDPCEEVYGGPFAFSEPETRNIRDYVLQLNPTPIVALCLHSFSQVWIYPFAFNQYPANIKEIVSKGLEFSLMSFFLEFFI
jgi:hypothetical protein